MLEQLDLPGESCRLHPLSFVAFTSELEAIVHRDSFFLFKTQQRKEIPGSQNRPCFI